MVEIPTLHCTCGHPKLDHPNGRCAETACRCVWFRPSTPKPVEEQP